MQLYQKEGGISVLRLLTILSGVGSLLGVTLFGYSMTQQTAIQGQMDNTMLTINQALHQTAPLVTATSKALTPLVATTSALIAIEQREQQTVGSIIQMNEQLQTTGNTEQAIVVGLQQLYSVSAATSQSISAVARVNGGLLSQSQSSAVQAHTEADQVTQLNDQTGVAISQLSSLNHKLSLLKLLP
ncbi:MAG: hypothetical protein OWR52_01600 [Acidibacillus sp.]|nr:hypothetical protein [Acidibacillus sp.]